MVAPVPPPDPNSHYGQLCSAVGLLFIQWAKFENEMSASLRQHFRTQARNTKRAARLAAVVYGSMRMKAARDTMKRIAQEHEYTPKALEFHEAFFSHIGLIESFRDKLAHQTTMEIEGEEGTWFVTDVATTRSYRNLKAYEFTTNAILAAAQDLVLATVAISSFLKKGPRRSAPKLPPWRYKSSMLKFLPAEKVRTLQVRSPKPVSWDELQKRLPEEDEN